MKELLLTKDQLRQKINVEDCSIDKEGLTIKYKYNNKTFLLSPIGEVGAATILKRAKLIHDFIVEKEKTFIIIQEEVYEFNEYEEMLRTEVKTKLSWVDYAASLQYKLSQHAALEMASTHEYDKIVSTILNQSMLDQIKYKKNIA